jgi:hypothetical protein
MIFHKGASVKNFIMISDNDPIAPATYKPARKNTVMRENATTIANPTALWAIADSYIQGGMEIWLAHSVPDQSCVYFV